MNKALKRNLYIMHKNYLFNIVFMIISIPFWGITSNHLGGMTLTVPMMTYSSVSIIEQFEELYNYNCILNSLPISRIEIVKSKFSSVLIIYFLNTILTLITELIYRILGVTEFVSFEMYILGIALSFLLSMIYGAGGTALVSRVGYGKLKIFGIILLLITMSTVTIPLFLLQNSNYILQVSAIFIIIGVVLYFIFQKYTMKVYLDKEF